MPKQGQQGVTIFKRTSCITSLYSLPTSAALEGSDFLRNIHLQIIQPDIFILPLEWRVKLKRDW